MKTLTISLVALFFTPLFTSADPIADLAKAKCMNCHNPSSSMARIEGQHSDYSYKSMIEYKTKIRKYDMMTKRLAPIDDATIRGLAEFFSKLPPTPGIRGDAALMALGKSLYENQLAGTGFRTCAECHGNNGEGRGFGDGLNARLAGQLSDFTISQMAVYKAGTIPNQVEMTKIAQKLTAEQVKALAEYIQSL